LGRETSDVERKKIFDSRKQYRDIENEFFKVAEKLGIIPSELQAICWYTWRERH
jgi:thermostable 8-oxoguanine DNA glycosylase